METAGSRRTLVWMGVALALVTAAVYSRVIHHDFINFDDPVYVTENLHVKSGLTAGNVVWAFTSREAGNWHPLTWLSHMLDCEFFGLNPGGHHAVSLLIHVANALLLFSLLRRLTGAAWRSGMVAGLFALHPLHIESVAWIAERKDVLSTLFGLLALHAYARHAQRKPGFKEPPAAEALSPFDARLWTRDHRLALVFFACSLMSKPMLVTLPFVLLLLDYWPLQRFAGGGPGLRRLILEKWPWFVLSGVSSLVTYSVQQSSGTVISMVQFPPAARLANSLISYVRYLGMTIYPADLAVIYPRPASWPLAFVAGAVLILILISAATLLPARRRPYLAVGWLWFLGTLVPVIGLVQVGRQALADRYTYFPLIGLFVAATWGAAELLERLRVRKAAAAVLAAVVLLPCAAITVNQLQYWRNSLALFSRALAVTTDNALAHNDLATALVALGRPDEALQHYAEAARLCPEEALIQNNLGTALVRAGKTQEAVVRFEEAVRLKPGYPEPYNNLGTILANQGRLEEARDKFSRALKLNPDQMEARNNLAGVLTMLNRPTEALSHYEAALRLNPNDAGIHLNLGLCLVRLGRLADAAMQFSQALEIDPEAQEARFQLGRCLLLQGQPGPASGLLVEVLKANPEHAQAHYCLGLAELELRQTKAALGQLREAARLRPDWPEPLNVLAWILATHDDPQVRNGAEAVALAEKAAELTGRRHPVVLHTLAAAYAEAGRFDEAVATAGQGIELAASDSQTNLVAQIQSALDSYKTRRPFRLPPR